MDEIIVFDTETTIDFTQRFAFGSARYGVRHNGRLSVLSETLIYADDLPERDPDGYRLLVEYANSHSAHVDMTFSGPREPDWHLHLLSRSEFAERWIWKLGYLRKAAIVGFNLPFDLSRIAVSATEARGSYNDGFSFALWRYTMRPSLRIKHVDSRKSFIGFSLSNIPGAPTFRGNFVDLRTATFALTNTPHSLNSACKAFNVATGKYQADEHGYITDKYIDYNRNDVKATWSLYSAVLREFERHPIRLDLTRTYSPASIAKAYYQAMGVTPPLNKYELPDELMGRVMSTFFGGRAECMIRKTRVPVTVLDFTSMYPTVNALMGLWQLLTARSIRTVDATESTKRLISSIDLNQCFDSNTWRQFVGIAKIRPDQDILPVRAKYGSDATYNIGMNYLTSDHPLWYAIPDLVASALLTGKAPEITEAIRFEPIGTDPALHQIQLRGELWIEPRGTDFFTHVVEERARVRESNPGLGDFLKVMANAGSYGIFAEMVRDDSDSVELTEVYSQPTDGWTTRVRHRERPGKYAFPPVATCITSAARLMLAMLERLVTDAGGSWAFCDTDSMAVVTAPFDHPDIPALEPRVIEAIRLKFDRLSPYDPELIPHLVKAEFTGWCYAISSKRYVLYSDSEIVKYSEHGLGHLRPASDQWMQTVWKMVLGNDSQPPWKDTPALGRWTVSTPALYRSLTQWNAGKAYADQIKPFGFLSVAYIRKEHKPKIPKSVQGFQLMTEYLDDPMRAGKVAWVNKYDPAGPSYEVSPEMEIMSHRIKVVTYGEVVEDYAVHPEVKFSGPDGKPSGPHTTGRLRRIAIRLGGIDFIGKESNRVEETQSGLFDVDDTQSRVTTVDQHWQQTRDTIFHILGRYRDGENARLLGVDPTTFADWKHDRTQPRAGHRKALTTMAIGVACEDLRRSPKLIKDARTIFMEWKCRL